MTIARKIKAFFFVTALVNIVVMFLLFTTSGCGGKKAEEKAEEAPAATEKPAAGSAAAPSRFNEAPMLRELVEAGKLPPVEERLPKNPFVRQVAIEIGDYGGTMRRVSGIGFADYGSFYIQGEMPGLFQIPMDLDWHVKNGGAVAGYEPKYAEWYKWSDEGKTLTIKIREGAKWSDGQPLNSEDIDWPF